MARWSISRLVASIAVEVPDQREQAVEPPARPFSELELLQKAQPAGAEQVAVGAGDAVFGENRADSLLERHPVAQEIAQVAQLPRGDVGLGEQIGAQQVGERAGVDRVGLHARRGDRLGP